MKIQVDSTILISLLRFSYAWRVSSFSANLSHEAAGKVGQDDSGPGVITDTSSLLRGKEKPQVQTWYTGRECYSLNITYFKRVATNDA